MCRLTLDNCTYVYQAGSSNAQVALENITLEIEQGEAIAIVGKGGSGKSTLALLLAGLYQPTTGQVLFAGKTKADGQIFPGVSIVFQYPEQQLFAGTVFDEIAFGPRNFGMAEENMPTLVQKALMQVGLDAGNMPERSPFTLSGGQKRRVCIASALVTEPQVIIFDEPSAGLDPMGHQWLRELMRSLQQQGRTVIWVSHDMEEVAAVADRVLLLDKGKLMMDTTPAELFSNETILAEAGIDTPPAALLVRQLKTRGIPVAGKAVTEEEAYREIAVLLRGDVDV